MKVYKNIIFDLFDTLILFKPELLPEILVNGSLRHSTGPDVYQTFQKHYGFYEINTFYEYFYKSYNKFQELKNIDNREYPNSKRFIIMLNDMKLEYTSNILDDLVISHMDSLEKSMIFPENHMEILNYLTGKSYNLSILSNFDYSPTAYKLLEKHNITSYFNSILISDEIGWRKPHIKTFKMAIEQINNYQTETVFIGDDLERDIKGAFNAGIDSIYINLNNLQNSFNDYNYTVNSLEGIRELL